MTNLYHKQPKSACLLFLALGGQRRSPVNISRPDAPRLWYPAGMSPATGDYLLFLHAMRHRRGQPIYDAIDLTPWAERRPDGWIGWLAIGSAEPEAVKVVSPHFQV